MPTKSSRRARSAPTEKAVTVGGDEAVKATTQPTDGRKRTEPSEGTKGREKTHQDNDAIPSCQDLPVRRDDLNGIKRTIGVLGEGQKDEAAMTV